MTIQAVELPKSSRTPKYDYTDALDTVREMLANDQSPGDGPFESQGKARSAANSLLEALGDEGKQYGARVWEVKGREVPTVTNDEGEEVPGDDPNGWYFGLKKGRQEYHGRKKDTAKKGTAAKK